MECLKCGNEKTLLSELIGQKIYGCTSCAEKLKESNDRLEKAKANRVLDSSRFKSGVSKRLTGVTFNDFKAPCSHSKHALDTCIAYATKVKQKELVGAMALIGKCGAGKTMLGVCMIESLGYDAFTSRIKTLSGLTLELKETWRHGSTVSESELIQFYTNQVDFLFIDEIGMQRNSDTEAILLFNIIDGRYNNMLPTVLASNLPIDQFKESVGERIIDRMRQDGGKVIGFNWESLRK